MSFSWPCRECGHYSPNIVWTCEKCGAPEKRIRYDWARVDCPTCGAKADFRCRAISSGRSTDAHARRIEMGNRERYRRSLAERGLPAGGEVS
jgi:uncharacterized Zn finger protein (UPF0148 family)